MYKEKFIHSPWVIGILFALWFLIIPLIIGVVLITQRNKELKKAQTFFKENDFEQIIDSKEKIQELEEAHKTLTLEKQELTKELDSYKPVIDTLEIKKLLNKKIDELRTESELLGDKINNTNLLIDLEKSKREVTDEVSSLLGNKVTIANEIASLQQEMILMNDELQMQSFGFYNPKYGFETSEAFSLKLNELKQKQKQLVKEKKATIHSLDWTIGADKKKGKEFILDTIKLIIRAFNNECDNIITKVKFSNVEISEQRIRKVYEELNKLTDMQRVSITSGYLNLKIEELYVKYEFEQKKQEEKEEQLEIKERMREEAKALKELEKAKEAVEKEEKHFEQAIGKLRNQMAESNGLQLAKLTEKLKELELQLEETKKNKEDVLYRVLNTRAGYVYIISNIGSFGENVYKIGMTRRLEPMDRVKELGDASVPFRFDVHGMIFSEDAPKLERELHIAFSGKRVNKINERKEFFKVSLNEIENVVKRNHNKTVEFTRLAEAEEYRQSVAKVEERVLQTVS